MASYFEGSSEDKPPGKKKKAHSGYEFEGENGFAEFGGYMDAKISKLDQQFAASKDPSMQESDLFAGISIFVNGLTNPSASELKLIMLKHSGTFHTYERSHTDFIIASNLPDVKIRNHSASRTIIRPEWISKCLEEKRIVDYAPYLLVTKRNHQQPRIMFSEAKSKESTAIENENEIEDLPPPPPPTKNQARTANDPNFLNEFYSNSRLHHISTLGSTFKQHISDLREKHSGDFPQRQLLLKATETREEYDSNGPSFIMHIDMDCFFVSVGLRTRPELIGKPIAVTHSKGNTVQVRPGSDLQYEQKAFHERYGNKFGNGSDQLMIADRTQSLAEIASCSYEARAKGVKNGMFVGSALKLCPHLKTIPYDFEGYKEVAFTLYNTIAEYTLDIEAVSCDEMYVDLTGFLRATGVPVMHFITYIRNEIKAKTGCSCSAGIGGNRIQARMATKKAKPNGQFYLAPKDVLEYFHDIPIADLPGVGRSTTCKLEKKTWKICGDLQTVPLSLMQQEFGKKFGETLHQLASGKDDKPLNFGQVRKSVSAEVNYGIRFTEKHELETFLGQLCQEVHNRLVEARRKGKCVTLKYMVRAADAPVETAKYMGHGVCDSVNKSLNLMEFTAEVEVIKRAVLQLNQELNIPPAELRGIGIQVTKLDGEGGAIAKDHRLRDMFSKVEEKNQLKEATVADFPKIQTRPFEIRALSHSISPPKNNNKLKKSPAKRGRPRKAIKKTKSITDLMRPIGVADDLDQDVLNELPEEFRAEAIRNHRLMMQRFANDAKNPPKSNDLQKMTISERPNVDEEFLAALPADIRREVEREMGIHRAEASGPPAVKEREGKKEKTPPKVTGNNESTNIFLQTNWKDLLTAWVETSEEPEEMDTSVVVVSLKEFISDRRMTDVYEQMRFLGRIINATTKCGWHRAYSVITNEIQQAMLSVLGRKLAIQDKIPCNKCHSIDSVDNKV